MCHSPVLSDLQAPYVAADRMTRTRGPQLVPRRAPARRRVASRLRRVADRLDG